MRDRSADRRVQLLDVGERLLGTDGSAAVGMRAVCREAGLSPRYFYESFDSREALLVAVYNRVEDRLMNHIADGGGAQPLTPRDVLERCANFFEEDPRRARILLREPLADDTLRKHSASRTPAFIRALIPLVGPELRDAVPRDAEQMEILSTVLGGALVALYLEWADGRLNVGRETVADAAAHVVSALVAMPGSAPPAR
ncbi:TetR family transcriptional regulator [Conexibacter woesei DSM] [Mycolicibacterium parafortuitum]|uniref:TetR family transcriptional regulator [Conexibacter woesei DSM] n=2 Tax=Mycolicibacterium parafortuitum TaxID=39692 RepID=A0A375YII5_MYCPF|nr:TetR family transcriptional regulator [Conexibacter woesei DSM] [Mycolicibacterium parafortuitum]